MTASAVMELHVKIFGTVQGVGFRAWTARTAKAKGLCGWVQNCADGSVEAILQGEQEVLQEMLEELKTGPTYAIVDQVESECRTAPNQLNGFEILR